MNKKERNKKGFTMVELIIVVAVMGVIGALLVPLYGDMTAKARLTTDISTVKTLKRISDVYKAEQGSWPKGTDLKALNETLVKAEYLDANAALQTQGADIFVTGTKIQLNLQGVLTDNKVSVQKALDKTDSQTAADWVTGMTQTKSAQ